VQTTALILAAGAGTRMKSQLPKVAHKILEKPLVRWSVDAAHAAGITDVVCVVGHGREHVEPLVADTKVAVQEEQLGTGHAVLVAREYCESSDTLVVLNGDSPLITSETIAALAEVRQREQAGVVVLTMDLPDPTGYGRVVRSAAGEVKRIVEQKDCTPEQAAITECNSGFYAFDTALLFSALEQVGTDNAQGEYYLTDVLEILRKQGHKALAYKVEDATECNGVNSRAQLAQAAALAQARINAAHMDAGVTLVDPATTYIGPDVTIGNDTVIWPNTHLYGTVAIAAGSTIEPNTFISE